MEDLLYMNIDTRVQFGLLVVTTLSLGWSAGYYSRGDRIETLNTELNSYKQAEKLNIAQTVKELEQVNELVLNNVNEIRSYADWQKDKKTLGEKVKSLSTKVTVQEEALKKSTDEIEVLNKTLLTKQAEINSLYPINELFWLDEKTTRSIAGFEGVLGVKNVQSSYVQINYANTEHTLYAGNYIEAKVQDFNCKIILSAIKYTGSPERAQFRTVCKKI